MNKKQLRKLVDQCLEVSFVQGQLVDAAIKRCVKALSQLPKDQAIYSLELFHAGLSRLVAQSTLVVESVTPVTQSQLSALAKSLKKQFTITQTRNLIVPHLVGGIRLRIGDTLIDDSVARRIEILEKGLAPTS